MHPTPYLFFNGNCAEALVAYADMLGATVEMTMPASQMPDIPVPEGRGDWIAHATLRVGDGRIMLSDDVFGNSAPMAGCSVMLSYPTATEAQTVFARLSEGGEVHMAFEPTFWSAGFGTLTDRFGIKWMIGTDQEPA